MARGGIARFHAICSLGIPQRLLAGIREAVAALLCRGGAELIFRVNQNTFRGCPAAKPGLPVGEIEEDGPQRGFSLEEVNEIRRRMKINRRSLMPLRPKGRRAVRVAVANFKGGAGSSTVALARWPAGRCL